MRATKTATATRNEVWALWILTGMRHTPMWRKVDRFYGVGGGKYHWYLRLDDTKPTKYLDLKRVWWDESEQYGKGFEAKFEDDPPEEVRRIVKKVRDAC